MAAPVFVDTNVFVYAIDESDAKKHQAARRWRDALWKTRLGRISYQVLQELYAVVAAKLPSARDEARAEIRDLQQWNPLRIDSALLELAWETQDRHRISFWDATIVAAARMSASTRLLTEDLQAGQDLDGILVISPFEHVPSDFV